MKSAYRFWIAWLVLILAAAACNYPTGGSPTPLPPVNETAPTAPVEPAEPVPGVTPEGLPEQPESQPQPGEPAGDQTLVPVDPHVELQPSAETLRVGETVTITANPVDIGLPVYELILRDTGVQDAAPVVSVTYDGLVTPLEGASGVLEFVSVENQMEQVTFTLRAISPGVTQVGVIATGEIQTGVPGSSIVGGGSGDIQITVTE